ncbi:MAG: thioredoxin family protein [Ginsengibacter sp.]
MRKAILIFSTIVIGALGFLAFKIKDNNKPILKTTLENSNGIRFIEQDCNKALKEAKQQHKLVFLDAYASWCGPCKLLKRNTFTDKNAGEFFNKNFVNVSVDMEKGYGPTLLHQYGVSAYPTLIITDASGNVVAYTRGYIKPKQLIEFGQFGLTKNKNK